MGALHVLCGSLFAIAWMFFIDGATRAKQEDKPFQFVQCVPGLLASIAALLIGLTQMRHILPPSDDDGFMMGGGGGGNMDLYDDESAPLRARCTFFFGAMLFTGALSMAIWQLVDPYKNMFWPGFSLIVQVLLLMAVAAAACYASIRAARPPADSF